MQKTELEVEYRGVRLRVLNQHRPLCVEYSAPAINVVVAACKEKAEEHAAARGLSSATVATKARTKHLQRPKAAPEQATAAPAPAEATTAPSQPAGASHPDAFSMRSLSPGIPAKVTWQPSVASWAVHYKEGSKSQVQRVRVKRPDSPNKSVFGAKQPKLDAAQMASLREEAFRDACRLWNELDTTKRPRIDLGESSVP